MCRHYFFLASRSWRALQSTRYRRYRDFRTFTSRSFTVAFMFLVAANFIVSSKTLTSKEGLSLRTSSIIARHLGDQFSTGVIEIARDYNIVNQPLLIANFNYCEKFQRRVVKWNIKFYRNKISNVYILQIKYCFFFFTSRPIFPEFIADFIAREWMDKTDVYTFAWAMPDRRYAWSFSLRASSGECVDKEVVPLCAIINFD